MQRRRFDEIRNRLSRSQGRSVPPTTPRAARKRRVPRREIEARRQRMVRIGVGIAAALVVAALGGGILYENVIKPNQVLATVGSHSINRQEYWRVRANDLYEQAQQYQQLAQFVPPEQQGQYLGLAQQSLQLLPKVWGSTDVDPTTLQGIIDDQTYLQGLPSLGLSLTPEEVETFALNRFAPPDAPLIERSPTPTFTAERAEMATSTAAAGLATPLEAPSLPARVRAPRRLRRPPPHLLPPRSPGLPRHLSKRYQPRRRRPDPRKHALRLKPVSHNSARTSSAWPTCPGRTTSS